MGETFIGIDLGTTTIKGATIDLDTLSLGQVVRMPFPAFITDLPASHREVDPHAIVDAVQDLVLRLLTQIPHCAGIVMCTQMHGLVLTDVQGSAVSNAITWQDQRMLDIDPATNSNYFQLLSQEVTDQDRLSLGNDLLPGRPLGILYWLHRHSYGAEQSQTLVPCSLPDYVLSCLCHTEPCTDLTNAAAHGALDLMSTTWRRDLIHKLGLSSYQWPRIVPHGTLVGHAVFDGQQIPCYVPIGDHQCALLGSLLLDDELSINASTGSQVSVLSTQPDLSLNYQTRPYFDNRFLKAVIHIPAGRALNALIRLLTELNWSQNGASPDPWQYIEHATSDVLGTDLRVNLAFFASSCGDRGFIENIHEENLTVADLFTAAFDNMAENYKTCAEQIAAQKSLTRIVFTGGLSQKLSGLRRAILKRLILEYRYAPTTEDTLMGLTCLSLLCSGRASTMAQATEAVTMTLNR